MGLIGYLNKALLDFFKVVFGVIKTEDNILYFPTNLATLIIEVGS